MEGKSLGAEDEDVLKAATHKQSNEVIGELEIQWSKNKKRKLFEAFEAIKAPMRRYLEGKISLPLTVKTIIGTIERLIRQKRLQLDLDQEEGYLLDKNYLAVFLVAMRVAAAYDWRPGHRENIMDALRAWLREKDVRTSVSTFVGEFGVYGDRKYFRLITRIFKVARNEVFKVTKSFSPATPSRGSPRLTDREF